MIWRVRSEQKEKQDIGQSWIGLKKTELLRSWGPPTGGVVSDGNGGEILTYNQGNTSYTRNDPFQGRVLVNESQLYHFYVDNKGVIYEVKWT